MAETPRLTYPQRLRLGEKIGIGVEEALIEELFLAEYTAMTTDPERSNLLAVDPGRPIGKSRAVWGYLNSRSKEIIEFIAGAARSRKAVRIFYRPKVTDDRKVYRTVFPYSLRVRNIHVNGYDKPPKKTVVFFGYDDNKSTIKMFVVDRIRTVAFAKKTYRPRWPVEFESTNTKNIFLARIDEDIDKPERDRDKRDTERPDASKSAAARKSARKNKAAQQKGIQQFARSAKGKTFYKKLARFNAMRGSDEDLGVTMKQLLDEPVDNHERELLRRTFK